jgi:hypothetical protein
MPVCRANYGIVEALVFLDNAELGCCEREPGVAEGFGVFDDLD